MTKSTSLPNKQKIAYSRRGEGTCIVLLHGFCEDRSLWEDFVEPIAEHHQLICIDLPGFGESDLATDTSIDHFSDAVIKILDTEKIEQAIFIGHSMGGYTALNLVARYSDRCLGIGLMNSHGYADSDFKQGLRQKSIDFISRNGSVLYVKQMINGLFEKEYASTNRTVVEKITLKATQYNPQGIIDAQKAMISRADHTGLLKSCTVPVLFIIGLKDQLILEKDNLQQLTFPPISKVSIQKNTAHMAMFEGKDATLKSILEFAEYIDTING